MKLVTIGDGFLMNGRTAVTIGHKSCQIQSVSYTEIECVTESANAWSGDITVSVLSTTDVTLTAACETDCSYTFTDLKTAKLTSVSPLQVSVCVYQLYFNSIDTGK